MHHARVAVGEVVGVDLPGEVQVKLDETGEIIAAERFAFPETWVFLVGDTVGVESVDGRWRTMPYMTRIEKDSKEIRFWVENRVERSQRLIGVNTWE